MTRSVAAAVARIVLPYLGFAALWIMASDHILLLMTDDPAALTRWSMIKGIVFVLVTALLLSGLLRRELSARERQQEVVRESEARLRALGDNLPASYIYHFTHDDDGRRRFLYLSAGVRRLHGVSQEAVLRDPSLLDDQIDPAQIPALLSAEQKSRQELTDFDMAVRFRAAGDQWRWLRMRSQPRATPDGEVVWDGVATDITRQVEAEEEIRALNVELEERVRRRTVELESAVKELEAFSYSVSHDLRAPLRAVDGFTEILIEDHAADLSEEGRRVCNVIRRSAREMSQLIDDLLAFSRTSRVPIRASAIDMTGLARAVFWELADEEGRGRIDFTLHQLPPAVGDPVLIRQVWMNLLSNALKFSSRRERAVIEVGTARRENETAYFVRDNGAGFAMRYAAKLFGVFQRLHSVEEFPGTGVGLAIVQRIVHRHGGRVWAEGEEGRGASFFFSLARREET